MSITESSQAERENAFVEAALAAEPIATFQGAELSTLWRVASHPNPDDTIVKKAVQMCLDADVSASEIGRVFVTVEKVARLKQLPTVAQQREIAEAIVQLRNAVAHSRAPARSWAATYALIAALDLDEIVPPAGRVDAAADST